MSQQRRLSIVLLLNVSMIAGLVIVGLTAHSLGVLAAGGDYVADAAAIALGLFAIHIRERSGGKSRATSVVALINASLLFLVTLVVVVEAIRRLTTSTPEIHGLPVLIVSSIAAVVMVIGAVIVGDDDDGDDLHMRSVLLDTVADAASAAAVAGTGGIILATGGLYWLDSTVALVIGVAIGYQAVRLVGDVIRSLRQTATST